MVGHSSFNFVTLTMCHDGKIGLIYFPWSSDFVIYLDTQLVYLCLPLTGSGDILFFPMRLSVRPSVRHKSCPLYNLKTVKDFSMKLGTLVNHDETMCRAQES